MSPLRARSIQSIVSACLTLSPVTAPADFSRDIQPLLAEHCYACHGPDAKTRKSGLRLDLREGAMGELKSGSRAIVPGDLEESEIIHRIFSKDPDEMMPPPDFRKGLNNEGREKLRDWVENGAKYEQHWSFRTLEKPEVPSVRKENWLQNPIDNFILSRLENQEMEPSSEASPENLIRRISLDLRGLPPTLSDLQRFAPTLASSPVGGETKSAPFSPEQYSDLVDAMIDSPHYGERMAQDWLDLARYGDTNGYHNDSVRDMWLYRDYVIESFNRNKPFDRFIVENMAGDLLPDADNTTRVASGFNRCVTFNEEGGADPDEFYVTYAVDRANTTGQVFLGLTVGCAQCHDHKYDPISQKEYYQLYAFFNSVDGEIGAGGRSGYHNKPLPPLLKVRTSAHQQKRADLQARLDSRTAELKAARERPQFTDLEGDLAPALQEWITSLTLPQTGTLPVKNGLQLHLDAGSFDAPGGLVKEWPDLSGNKHTVLATGQPMQFGRALNGHPAIRLDGKQDFLRTESGAGRLGGDFTMVLVLQFNDLARHQMALMWGDESQGKRRAFWKTGGNQQNNKSKLSFNGYGADVIGHADLKRAVPVVAVVTQQGPDNDTRFRLNGKDGGGGGVSLSGFQNKSITIGANNAGAEKTAADFAEILVYDRALDANEQAAVGFYLGTKYRINGEWNPAPAEIMALAAKPGKERTEDEKKKLFSYFITYVHAESRDLFRELESKVATTKKELDQIAKSLPTTMVMVEMKDRKPAHVLMRGDFRQPGEEVEPDVPAIFPRLPANQPRNRLGLAYWLTDPKHPLVSRVMVNRLWKQLFGTGLVKTLGDFGTQGERPSHPELLDWLAADFIESGWNIKRLQKLIISSATYRQSSANRSRYKNQDPDNRFLCRAPRFRLSAEEIRDSALSISGLLNTSIGGASVFPYQPANYLSSIGKGWTESKGEALYRRGLYTFWRRTMLYPSFQIFDAPSREFCSVNRPRTNTPLQALVTLNDPSFVEAARVFAQRALSWEEMNDQSRIHLAFVMATSRAPSESEMRILTDTLSEQKEEFGSHPERAQDFISNGRSQALNNHDPVELAAWTSLGSILLNLDETITRE
ncbi:MAG TPA: hypothetical protein DIV39_00125 [Verrucomicrobiales bacterium]|nr:hypothetical protein [Verrucomicrobiales bacterium]